MASSGPLRRTKGTVVFSSPNYGFIEITNKNIPVQKVYFDSRSIPEGKGCKLLEKYPKGTEVSFTFILAEGEHKVKYKAINVLKLKQPNDKNQRNNPVASNESNMGSHQSPDRSRNGWANYLQNYLSEHGAQQLHHLVEDLKTCSDNCPKSLRNASISSLVDFINQSAGQLDQKFEIKLDFICVSELEIRVLSLLEYKVKTHEVRVDDVRSFLKASEQPGIYLHGKHKWPVGFFNFIGRNADKFIVWNKTLWKHDQLVGPLGEMFQNDMKAVRYYSQFAKEAPVPLSSLSGHFNQASPEVKAVATPKEADFKEFLKRNSFVFETYKLNDTVMVRCHVHQLSAIEQHLKPEKCTKSNKNKKRSSKGKQKEPINNNYLDADAIATNSKAFTDLQQLKLNNLKLSQPCSDEGGFAQAFSFQSATPVQPLMSLSVMDQRENPQKGPKKSGRKFFCSEEEKSFKNVIGQEIAELLEKKLLSSSLTLHNLILLRLNVGKQPVAKVYNGKSTSNTTLENAKKINIECLHRIVRSNNVARCEGSQQYAVRNTLCSLRVLEQNGKLSGVTVFCQLHEDRDGIGIDIKTRRRLTAVISDPERLPSKYVYNYIRTRCRELASGNDVLVIDLDGQLSGCNDRTHTSLGDVSRMLCSSSEGLSEKISEAVQHSHDYVVVVGVDSVEILEKIQKMCSKGIRVIAEIPSELLKDVERIFPA